MGKRWIMGLVAVVAVVAVGGIGFAAFTTSAYINANASAGTLNLYWTLPESPVTCSQSYNEPSYSVTSFVNGSDTLNIAANNLAPGDYCTFYATLNDGGSLPANVYDGITALGGSCTWFYEDNFGSHSAPPVPETPLGPLPISPSSPINYGAYLGMVSGQGNGCQGATLSFTVTVTATAT